MSQEVAKKHKAWWGKSREKMFLEAKIKHNI